MATVATQRKLPLAPTAATRVPYVSGPRGDVTQLDEQTKALRSKFRIALISMPFQAASKPSIQIGLLHGIALSHGFAPTSFHLALDFASRVGHAEYEELSVFLGRLTGDWFFSRAAFREEAPDKEARFLADFGAEVIGQLGRDPNRAASPTAALRSRLTALQIRDEVVPAFLDAMMREVNWSQFDVVAFTCVFMQTVASIALARRIKEAFPQVRTLFGGSSFDDEMGLELTEKMPWIDYAVIGEGDIAFPELLVALSEGRPAEGIPGVASRVEGKVVFGGEPRLFEEMDQLPVPWYDEYFARAETTGFAPRSRVRRTVIPYESARGCWWGAKHHCTFCGLNAHGMTFRAKSPPRVASELAELSRKYGTFSFHAADNIVDVDYLKSLFPHLVEDGRDYKLFYEMKANLTREQLRTLRDAGVAEIQPGIESLSTRVLSLMRKGTTAAQNVNTLRWATYYGLWVAWNVLWGFPGETPEDYAQQAALVPRLVHITPPVGTGARIRMHRFSPLYADREKFELEFRRAEESYAYVFPSTVDLDKVAYSFDYALKEPLPDAVYAPLATALRAWRGAWEASGALVKPSLSGEDVLLEGRTSGTRLKPTLTFSYSDDFVQISDTRRNEQTQYALEGPRAELYKAAVNLPITAAKANDRAQGRLSVSSAEETLEELCEMGLMMKDGEKFLALALPATRGR